LHWLDLSNVKSEDDYLVIIDELPYFDRRCSWAAGFDIGRYSNRRARFAASVPHRRRIKRRGRWPGLPRPPKAS